MVVRVTDGGDAEVLCFFAYLVDQVPTRGYVQRRPLPSLR